MFDLSRSFLAQIAAEQKKVWFLYGFSVMFIGGIYRIKRNWKDNDQKRKLYYLLITWRKSENYTFKLYLFSTAAGRIKSSLTEDSKYTYRNARTGAKSWTQEFFLPQSNVVTRSSTDTTQIFTGGAAISSSENEKIPDKDTFYALYIVFYIRLPTQRIIMFDRRRQSLCRFSVLKNWMLLYRIFYTLGLHYWFFLCLISFNAHGIRKVHDNNNTHRYASQETTTHVIITLYALDL
jgi:hypothetical protein